MTRPGPWGTALRLGLTLAMLAVLLVGQVGRHDDWWPLGMLGQYAHPRDPDGEVVDTYLLAEDRQGRRREVPLRAGVSGLTRVELEVELPRLRQDPSRLAPVARALRRSQHLDVRALEVHQRIHQLRAGGRNGEPTDREVLRWVVP